MGLMGTNFREIRIGILLFSFKKLHLKLSSAESFLHTNDRPVIYGNLLFGRCFSAEEDVARATLYLLSDKSDMITGTILSVDGGVTI